MECENTLPKRKYRTPAQRAEIIEQYHRSGLTRIAFAQSHGIPISTLSKWLTATRQSSRNASPLLFREVRLPIVPSSSASQWAMEVVCPDGVLVRCREPLPVADMAWLLRGR
jgi:transposase-like protein